MRLTKKTGCFTWLGGTLVVLFLVILFLSWMEPEEDLNPGFSLNDISGRWVDGTEVLELTVAEKRKPSIESGGDYTLEDPPHRHSGTWTRSGDWHIELEEAAYLRVIKVGDEFRLLKSKPGQELRHNLYFKRP